MIKITKLAKFPIEYSRGTDSEKIELAKKMNAEFFKKISKKFKTGEVSFDTFERTLKETIPAKSSVKVCKAGEQVRAYGYTALSSKNNVNINGYRIHLKANENGKISINSVQTFMHETYHYFSQMAAPKEPRRILKLLETGQKDKFSAVYEMFLYNNLYKVDKKILNRVLNSVLARLSIEQKIDFLQYCRYGLRSEANAFAEGEKYGRIVQKRFKDKITGTIQHSDNKSYKFDMKIKLLNEKLKKIMTDYRDSMRNPTPVLK